jgi:hypothetical protein
MIEADETDQHGKEEDMPLSLSESARSGGGRDQPSRTGLLLRDTVLQSQYRNNYPIPTGMSASFKHLNSRGVTVLLYVSVSLLSWNGGLLSALLTNLTDDGSEVKPGDYVIFACENGSGEEESGDLPDIARVDKFRSDGLLSIT